MTLQEQLDAHKARAQARRTPDEVATLDRAVAELRRSGILAGVPGTGRPAPAFTLPDAEGRPVDSAALLARGPLVATFYRTWGIDLASVNGDDSWTLPMPARFVIDRAGIIRAADVDPDYTRRPEPAATVAVLRALTSTP